MKELVQHRKKIDHIDREILKLLSERGKLAKAIGKIKNTKGKAIHVPSREKMIFDRLSHLNKGPYKDESVWAIFREIISATRSLEAPLRISYLGPEATFTHLATEKYFGTSAEMIPQAGIQTIFAEVERDQSDYGVVPIENSTEGVVSHTLDMFVHSNLKVCAEVVIKIRHHLLSKHSELKSIKKVYSHPHALAQCRGWLMAHLPNVMLKDVASTALAAKLAVREKSSAAIASEIASNVHGLPMLKRDIQDQAQNFTRFLVIGHHFSDKTGADKTSILLTLQDKKGGLYKVLAPFANAGVNLTKIESRPLKDKTWQYMFFIDLDGHVNDKKISKALRSIEKKCVLFKILGSYPKSHFRG